jgi:hypothetical protein
MTTFDDVSMQLEMQVQFCESNASEDWLSRW